jgi:hypothetical protein
MGLDLSATLFMLYGLGGAGIITARSPEEEGFYWGSLQRGQWGRCFRPVVWLRNLLL